MFSTHNAFSSTPIITTVLAVGGRACRCGSGGWASSFREPGPSYNCIGGLRSVSRWTGGGMIQCKSCLGTEALVGLCCRV